MAAMGLPPQVLIGVGIIHANDPLTDRPGHPIGTGFAVGHFDDEAGTSAPFMVTARHVVDGMTPVWGLLRINDETNETAAFKLNNWIYPDDPRIDLAIHVLQRTVNEPDRPILTWSTKLFADKFGVTPQYGERVYYAGLHHLNPTTYKQVMPLVRTATLAGMGVPDQTWGTGRMWGPTKVFLIDGRPWPGYSGSPVFMESRVPGPVSDLTPPLAEAWKEQLIEVGGPDPDELTSFYNFHALLGILCAMEGGDPGFDGTVVPTGIGFVLPVSRLTELLDSPAAKGFLA